MWLWIRKSWLSLSFPSFFLRSLWVLWIQKMHWNDDFRGPILSGPSHPSTGLLCQRGSCSLKRQCLSVNQLLSLWLSWLKLYKHYIWKSDFQNVSSGQAPDMLIVTICLCVGLLMWPRCPWKPEASDLPGAWGLGSCYLTNIRPEN